MTANNNNNNGTTSNFDEGRAQEWTLIQYYIESVLRREEVAKLDCALFRMAFQGVDVETLELAVEQAQEVSDAVEAQIVDAMNRLNELTPLGLNRAILIGNLNHGSKYFRVSVQAPTGAVERLQAITQKHIAELSAVGDELTDFAKIGKADVMAWRDALDTIAKAHDKKSGLNRRQAEAMFFGMVDVKSKWHDSEKKDYKIAVVKTKGRSAIDSAVRTLVASKLQESYIANLDTMEGQQWLLAQETK